MAAYQVLCSYAPQLNGQYKDDGTGRWYYKRSSSVGELIMVQHSTGQWGIGDGKVYWALARDATALPTEVRRWDYIMGDGYVAIDSLYVTELIEAVNKPEVYPARSTPSNNDVHSPTQASAVTTPLPTVPHPTAPVPPKPDPKPEDHPSDWVRQVNPETKKMEYFNRRRNIWQVAAPEPLINVGQYTVTLAPTLQIAPYVPIKFGDGPQKRMQKRWHAAVWAHSDDFWQRSLVELENQLLNQHSLMDYNKRAGSIENERQTMLESIQRLTASIAHYSQKEETAQKDLMTTRMGKMHVRRDERLTPRSAGQPTSTFPGGEQITMRYEATFGERFEEMALQATAYLEDATKGRGDAADVLINDVIAPLFRETAKHVKHIIDTKYKRLSDVFGLPEEEMEDEYGEISIARQFFLAQQQEPLLAAAENVDEASLKLIFKAVGSKAVDMRANLAAWGTRNGYPTLTFDLTKIARELLWVHAAIELSDPKCYLYPEPGLGVVYEDNKRVYKEVFRPGIKISKPLATGDRVQVVVPGLYFRHPAASDRPNEVVPVVVAKVRRINETVPTTSDTNRPAVPLDFCAKSPSEVLTERIDAINEQYAAMTREVAASRRRQEIIRARSTLVHKYTTAEDANQFEQIAQLGIDLEDLAKESKALPLSDADYITLPARHAELVNRFTALCDELMNAKQPALLRSSAQSLAALKQLDLSYTGEKVTGVVGPQVRSRPVSAAHLQKLEGDCAQILSQTAAAPARKALMQRADAVNTALLAAKAEAKRDFVAIADLQEELEVLEAETLAMELSVEDYGTLFDRYAALVQRVTTTCEQLRDSMQYPELKIVAAKLKELQSLNTTCMRLEPHHDDPVYVSPNGKKSIT